LKNNPSAQNSEEVFYNDLVNPGEKRSFSMKSDRSLMDEILNVENAKKLAATEADLAKAREENARLTGRIPLDASF